MERRIDQGSKKLNLDPSQWLERIEARTVGVALEMVKETRIMIIEPSLEHALEEVWSNLKNRFRTTERPSKQPLQELIRGPVISTTDANKLFGFSQKCTNIAKLQRLHHASLIALDEKTT